MVSPPSSTSDAPMLTRFSKTSIQWHSAIDAVVAISRFRKKLSQSTPQEGNGSSEHLQSEDLPTQNGATSEHDDTSSQASQSEEIDLDKALDNINREIKVLTQFRIELAKQLDAYGLVLVLLAGITFVAILQPPGSFDDGKLQGSLLVSLFMLLATLSFLIACTGLGAVMVGCAQLFRPICYPKIAKYAVVSESKRLSSDCPTALKSRPSAESILARLGFVNWLLECWGISPSPTTLDDIDVLANLCNENVSRIMRIRIYLGMALVLCIAAYICGALAVMVTNDRQRYLLVGAMGAGGVILIFEIFVTVSAAMKPESKSSDGSLQPPLQQQVRDYPTRNGGHTVA